MTTAWLEPAGLVELVGEAARHRDEETGGMLLGYRNDGAIVITDVVGPGPAARHGRFTFRPDAQWQQGQVAKTYAASGRTTTYLGDWHTHPGGSTTLSRRDIRTLRGISRAKGARQPQPLMAVLAFDDDPQDGRLVVWELPGRYRRPVPCRLQVMH
ncbi:hypothetical protein ASG49_04295 [Marmoricola sp. Leaf446]|uniref:Mov34/MPN/PAD-1 family protein n=1 Tax=Marmoricola sp. Leaf446 TaxID=1736379 RepID=UPI0006F9321B|nr:Mov34/MPN/PAD-1 family protein [Marmoricola sp. Leaf446]KQT94137.1 hypothetical protein ASG49_04295 [Marmoricola sp. Leaf446]